MAATPPAAMHAPESEEFTPLLGAAAPPGVSGGELSSDDEEGYDVLTHMPRGDAEAVRGTIAGSVFNLANTIVGAGTLSLPFAFRNSGAVLGGILLVVVGAAQWYSLVLLSRCMWRFGVRSYEELAERAYPVWGKTALTASLMLLAFGPCIAFLRVIGELMVPLIELSDEDNVMANRTAVISLFTWTVVLALASLRYINSLEFTSVLSMLATLYVAVLVVVRYFYDDPIPADEVVGETELFRNSPRVFLTLAILSQAFGAHYNVFPILRELREPTRARIQGVHTGAVALCVAVYVAVGTSGYLTFLRATEGNIFLNYADDDNLINTARGAMVVVLTLSFPLLSLPCRHSLRNLIDPIIERRYGNFDENPRVEKFTHYGTTFGIVLLAYGLALSIPGIEVVFSFTGSFAASLICYIFPGLFYLKMRMIKKGTRQLFAWRVLLPTLLLGGGVILFFVGTTISFVNLLVWED